MEHLRRSLLAHMQILSKVSPVLTIWEELTSSHDKFIGKLSAIIIMIRVVKLLFDDRFLSSSNIDL